MIETILHRIVHSSQVWLTEVLKFSARSADAPFQSISMSSSAIPLFRCGELLPCGSTFNLTNRRKECQKAI